MTRCVALLGLLVGALTSLHAEGLVAPLPPAASARLGSFDVRWGDRLAVSLVVDLWLIAGAGETRTTVAPGLALRWTWPDEEAPL